MIHKTLQRARANSSLSLRALARQAGIAPANLSVIENGRRDPTAATAERIARALGVELVALDTKGRVTAAAAADAIKEAASPQVAYRAYLQLASDLAAASPFDRVILSAEQPGATHTRWDDAIAGLVEWLLKRDHAPVPDWVADRPGNADSPWEPQRTNTPVALHADIRRAPEPLRRRGVAIEEEELTAA
ncbi:helix-turn-helix transcriptional regulator [Microbacterium marinum]|uniref:helix-turn-helix domain-containing protein n=1 Tax=Microbacterium marinum TaxID=421115 RepID=UPI00384E6F90